jgi:hypothetical protein
MYSTFSPLTSPHHMNRKYLQRNTLKWWLKNAKKSRVWFLSLQQCNQLTFHAKTNCFHFLKFDNHNNKSNITLKSCDSETVAHPKKLYLHFLFHMISSTKPICIAWEFWITLYMHTHTHACMRTHKRACTQCERGWSGEEWNPTRYHDLNHETVPLNV